MTIHHHHALLLAAADPLIWEQHPESDRYKPEVFRRYLDGAMASGGALVAIENTTGQVIGASRYYEYDAGNKMVAVGYTFLVRQCWGNGYNNEMKRLMLHHAFQYVDTVIFHVGAHNYRSQKAVAKTGAVLHHAANDKPEYWLHKHIWLQMGY
jgi:RimJ/RimL family protein N-acetyltransferase